MQDKPSGAQDGCVSTIEEDLNAEALILREILRLYPETLTLEELVREVGNGSTDFAQRDQVHRAVRELSKVGLLRRVGAVVMPTRAACYFDDIDIPV